MACKKFIFLTTTILALLTGAFFVYAANAIVEGQVRSTCPLYPTIWNASLKFTGPATVTAKTNISSPPVFYAASLPQGKYNLLVYKDGHYNFTAYSNNVVGGTYYYWSWPLFNLSGFAVSMSGY